MLTQEEKEGFNTAKIKTLIIPTSHGNTRVFQMEDGLPSPSRPIFFNFHGGGFVGGRMDRDELFCRKMAYELRAVVLDVDYKLAPEFPYPIAAEECWDVVDWAWNHRLDLLFDPEKMVVMGHSSGGNLAAGICMRAGQKGEFQLCCAVLDYPPLDLATDPGDKVRTVWDMPADRARDYNRKYIHPEQAKEPFASPFYASDSMLEVFPPTLMVSAGEDSLHQEDEEFALKLAQAGVEVTMKRFTGSIHGFVMNRVCQWEEAMDLIVRFVKGYLQ